MVSLAAPEGLAVDFLLLRVFLSVEVDSGAV